MKLSLSPIFENNWKEKTVKYKYKQEPLHFYFDIRTMEIGDSSALWEHHGAGLHAKDLEMQNKAKQRGKGVAIRDYLQRLWLGQEKLLNGA